MKHKQLKHYNQGFTLIELLVVVSIISLLASVITVNVAKGRVKSRDSRRIADLQVLQQALEIYHIDNGQYPRPASSHWVASYQPEWQTELGALLSPKYLIKMPTPPAEPDLDNIDFDVNVYVYETRGPGDSWFGHTSSQGDCFVMLENSYYLGSLVEDPTNSFANNDNGIPGLIGYDDRIDLLGGNYLLGDAACNFINDNS